LKASFLLPFEAPQWICSCSKPNEKVRMIYAALELKQALFPRKKSVVLKTGFQSKSKIDLPSDTS
jgi:hypothetical protein